MGVFVAVDKIEKIFTLTQSREYVGLENMNLEVKQGEFISLMGYSGYEKSTLLKIITGLNFPTNSVVTLEGQRCMFVLQNYSILPWKTVYENIALAVDRKMEDLPMEARKANIEKYINLLGLRPVTQKYPKQLSKGMKQRLAIARALTIRPQLLLLDEPFADLDVATKRSLQKELLAICQEFRITSIMVTQDVEEALFLSDRIAILTDSLSINPKKALEVNIPHPRKQQLIQKYPNYSHLYSEITGLLNQQKQSENLQARKPTQMLSLSIKKNVNLGRMSPSLI